MLELWRWACAAGVAGGGAADCLEVAVVGATLVAGPTPALRELALRGQ